MMNNKKKTTRFDDLVDSLIQQFSNIPNFDLVRKDGTANRAFNMITFRIAEISSYKELVSNHFIPATNRAIIAAKEDFRNSKYKAVLDSSTIDFNETLHDTIRLAYVGLFHKIESFANDLIATAELLFQDSELVKTETLEHWLKKNYKFQLKDWQRFDTIFKINWISNCVKHWDGFPIKTPKPRLQNDLNENKRINISPAEFKNDCDELLQFYPVYWQMVVSLAALKYAWDTCSPENNEGIPEMDEFYHNQQQDVRQKTAAILEKLENLHSVKALSNKLTI